MLELLDVAQLHSPLNAATDGGTLVAREVAPGAKADLGEDPLQQALCRASSDSSSNPLGRRGSVWANW